MAARTFRYCLLHDLGEPGRRGYSLWLVVHWLKSRLPEVALILRRHQEGVEMIFPRFHDRAKKFNWRPVAPNLFLVFRFIAYFTEVFKFKRVGTIEADLPSNILKYLLSKWFCGSNPVAILACSECV